MDFPRAHMPCTHFHNLFIFTFRPFSRYTQIQTTEMKIPLLWEYNECILEFEERKKLEFGSGKITA